jgi:hypothetical protein
MAYFGEGIRVASGLSAAAGVIAIISNVLTMCGGSSGTAFAKSDGTSFGGHDNAGAWSFFPNTNANLSMSLTPASTAASYARSIGWGIGGYDASLPTAGTISAGEKLVLYRNGSSIETKIGVGDTSTVAGTYLAVGGSGSTGNGIAFAIYSAAATTTYTSIMSATYAGAFTWGPSSGSNLTHVVQSGASTYLNIKAGGVGVSVINADGGSKVLYIQVNGTNVSSVGETGSWGFPLVYNITVGATNRDLYIDNTGIIGYVSSSIRYKENIREMVSVLANINKFRPCIFDYKDASKGVNKVGVIAEDFQDWLPNIVSYAENGEVETIQHSALAVVALKGVQELAAENDLLKARIAALEAA